MMCYQEFLRSTVDLADLFGLYLVMTKIAGKGDLKVLVAGLGEPAMLILQLTQTSISCPQIRKKEIHRNAESWLQVRMEFLTDPLPLLCLFL